MTENNEIFLPKKKLSGADLERVITESCEGLVYISETDAPFLLIAGGRVSRISAQTVVDRFGDDRSKRPIEEIGFKAFFGPLTKMHEWYREEERQKAGRFRELCVLLESNLSEVHVYRVGRVQIDIYVAGLDAEGKLYGIKTKAVET